MTLWWSTLCVAAPLLAAVLLFIRPKWMAGIALVAVASANRGPVTLRLLPEEMDQFLGFVPRGAGNRRQGRDCSAALPP